MITTRILLIENNNRVRNTCVTSFISRKKCYFFILHTRALLMHDDVLFNDRFAHLKTKSLLNSNK